MSADPQQFKEFIPMKIHTEYEISLPDDESLIIS